MIGNSAQMARRKKADAKTEAVVITKARRICAICWGIHRDSSPKEGQLAHLNRDPSKSTEQDLCWLCLYCHARYDSTSRQTKGFLPEEVKIYRDELYDAVAQGELPKPADQAVSGARLKVDVPEARLYRWSKETKQWLLTVHVRAANTGGEQTGVRSISLGQGAKSVHESFIPSGAIGDFYEIFQDPNWRPDRFKDGEFLTCGPDQMLMPGAAVSWTACFRVPRIIPDEDLPIPWGINEVFELSEPLQLNLVPVKGSPYATLITRVRLMPPFMDGI